MSVELEETLSSSENDIPFAMRSDKSVSSVVTRHVIDSGISLSNISVVHKQVLTPPSGTTKTYYHFEEGTFPTLARILDEARKKSDVFSVVISLDPEPQFSISAIMETNSDNYFVIPHLWKSFKYMGNPSEVIAENFEDILLLTDENMDSMWFEGSYASNDYKWKFFICAAWDPIKGKRGYDINFEYLEDV